MIRAPRIRQPRTTSDISLYAALAPCIAVCAVWAAWSFWPTGAPASETEAPKPGLQVKATLTTENVLQMALTQKKPVVVLLRNGASYRARVADVGSNAVVLDGVPGKEFFAVHVPLSEVAAVELRVKD